jgi:hypothetical protein
MQPALAQHIISSSVLILPYRLSLAYLNTQFYTLDRFCGLVGRVPGYRSRGPGFDFRLYQIFWEVVGLEQGPLSLVSTNEGLLGRKSSCSCLGNREYGRRDSSRWHVAPLYSQKLALISPTSGGRSVGIVHSQTQATEFNFSFSITLCCQQSRRCRCTRNIKHV